MSDQYDWANAQQTLIVRLKDSRFVNEKKVYF